MIAALVASIALLAQGDLTSGSLRYSGPTSWAISGPPGGPFAPSDLQGVLTNTSSKRVIWAKVDLPDFGRSRPLVGILVAGAHTDVTATLLTQYAARLPIGVYSGPIVIENFSQGTPAITITCTLTIANSTLTSTLSPGTGLVTHGLAGGPFQPPLQSYALVNTGTVQFTWQAQANQPWLALTPTTSTSPPGSTVGLAVSVSGSATSTLAPGTYSGSFEVKNAADGSVMHSRSVSLTIDPSAPPSSGWTNFTPSADTRTVYVSSSTGNDSNSGLSQSTPKRTLGASRSLMRSGYPDWLLLKCGDAWDESFGDGWQQNGRSNSERMLVSSYGSGPRPLIRTGTGNGFSIWGTGTGNNLAVVGLHFWGNLLNGSNGAPRGIQVYGNVSNLLIEDCYLQAFDTNMVIQGGGRHTNVSLRRNVVVDAFTTTGSNTAGLFASSIDGFLVEENLFDHNGWRDDIPGSSPNIFRRNVYVQNGATNVVFRGNIISGTDGIQLRPGGMAEENLFMQNAIALLVGGGNTPDEGGVTGTVRRNVFLDGRDLGSGNPRGWGLVLENISQASVDGNVIAHNTTGHMPFSVTFGVAGNGAGIRNVTFTNNVVYDWGGYSRFVGNASQTSNVQIQGNKFQNLLSTDPLIVHNQADSPAGVFSSNNAFYSIAPASNWMQIGGLVPLSAWKSACHDSTSIAQQTAFPDPHRTIATYNASIGGGASYSAFLTEARRQGKALWRTQYTAKAVNDYVRAGFGF